MLNEKSLAAVSKAGFSKQFCKPLYSTYCFSRIPGTVQNLFGKKGKGLPKDTIIPDDYEVVVLFLIDGFGWRFFEKYVDKYPFLKRFIEKGIVSKITSQFPSTTAAHVTSLNTGLDVGETGVFEWFYYEPMVDQIISPLMFCYGGDKEPGTLLQSKIPPKEFFPPGTIYQQLKKENVNSFIIQHEGIAHSPYSNVLLKGGMQIPYFNFVHGINHAISICKEGKGQKYIHVYLGDIDAMGHRAGIDSPEFAKAVDECFKALENVFFKEVSKLGKKIACLVTADHGMVDVDPKTTFYINLQLKEILPMIKKNKKGNYIAPGGSCRDFFLYIEEDKLDLAEKLLKERLSSIAEVYKTTDLIDQNFFGKIISPAFLNRVGNLVILPFEGEAVWWKERHRYDQHFFGSHGGLTRNEMETIFLFQSLA